MAKATSKAGQLKSGTKRGARTSRTTVKPNFTNSHSMKLTADTPGFKLVSRLVMPRAIRLLGTTTAMAP